MNCCILKEALYSELLSGLKLTPDLEWNSNICSIVKNVGKMFSSYCHSWKYPTLQESDETKSGTLLLIWAEAARSSLFSHDRVQNLWGEKHWICTLQPFSPDSTLQAHHYSIAITMANVQTFTAKTYHVTSTDMNQNSFRPCYKCKKLLLRKSPTLNCFFVVRDNSEFKTGVGNRKPFHYFKQEFMAIRK